DYSKDIEDLVDKIERPSKMNALLQLVDQIVSESKTAIVWCIFIRTMYKLKSDLNKVGIRAEVISGSVSQDRKSTRLNSSHVSISYAVFCLKKKKKKHK